MRTRLVVFPIKGRNWCFGRSVDSVSGAQSSSPAPTLKDLWQKFSAHRRSGQERAEIAVDFVADRMNRAWIGLEKAPAGTMKSRIHSLNPRYVRRRLRHIAMRGSAAHKKYFYGSVSLLPATSVLSVLPLPNIPFFWILFRTYSHWRALQGSEKLMLLVSDCPKSWSSLLDSVEGSWSNDGSKSTPENPNKPSWVLQPSEDLERLLAGENIEDGVSCLTISRICKVYDLNKMDVLKYRDSP